MMGLVVDGVAFALGPGISIPAVQVVHAQGADPYAYTLLDALIMRGQLGVRRGAAQLQSAEMWCGGSCGSEYTCGRGRGLEWPVNRSRSDEQTSLIQ